MVRMLLAFFQTVRAGHFATVDPLHAQLLGRETRTVADLLVERS